MEIMKHIKVAIYDFVLTCGEKKGMI